MNSVPDPDEIIKWDIGRFVRRPLSTDEKAELIDKEFVPGAGHSFPTRSFEK